MTDGTTLLFGLPGVRVERVERVPDGARVVHVVTDEPTAAACPACGVVSTSVKGRVTTSPKDIPYGQDRIAVRWNKIRWRCREDYCERASFTEAIAQVPARARTTGRLRAQIGAAIGDAARSVTEVADAHGVSWPTAHRAFVDHADAALPEPAPTRVLGIDETRRGKPRWAYDQDERRWVRVDPWDTGFVDLDGDQGLLGQQEGRTGATVVDWLTERTPEFRAGIEFVAIDPAAIYASAIRTPGLLPNATLVVDHFHLVKLGNDAVTKVRRRVVAELHQVEVIDHQGGVGNSPACRPRRRRWRPVDRHVLDARAELRCARTATRPPSHRCGLAAARAGPGSRPGRRTRCPRGRPAPSGARLVVGPPGLSAAGLVDAQYPGGIRLGQRSSAWATKAGCAVGHDTPWASRPRSPSGPHRRSPRDLARDRPVVRAGAGTCATPR